MPENSIHITVTPAQLSHLHNALVDYMGKISGLVSGLACADLPTADAENLLQNLRALSSALCSHMPD